MPVTVIPAPAGIHAGSFGQAVSGYAYVTPATTGINAGDGGVFLPARYLTPAADRIPAGAGKRLRRVHKLMKGYGERWQYSVFFCVLRDIDRVRMQSDLESAMNLREDQALVVELGADEKASRQAATAIGQPLARGGSGTVVI